jgi:hypothetical protein
MSILDDPREQERHDLYVSGVEAFPNIPDLASRWLEVLSEEGGLPFGGTPEIRTGGKLMVRGVTENPANTSSDPLTSHVVLENGQTVWVRRAKRPNRRGYRSVGVVARPDRTAKAVLAMLTLLEGRRLDKEVLERLLPLVDPADGTSIADSLHHQRLEEPRRGGGGEGAASPVGDIAADRPLRYAHALLRYYRPGFDSLATGEKRELLQKCCERVDGILETTRLLAEFLEYGRPRKDLVPFIRNPQRDVEAAVLREVEGMKYREIAQSLEVDSERARDLDDYSTVSKMVKRGRDILERAFGHEGWDELAESMRNELARREVPGEDEELDRNPARG